MQETADRLLERDHVVTRERIATLAAELHAVDAASAGSNQDDEHDPEGATIAFERAQLAALHARAQRHLDDVIAARERLAMGRYGMCERCGDDIAPARLDTLPATRWCTGCASAASAR